MATATPTVVHYPGEDGKPRAETWLHVRAIMLLHQALEDFFHGRPDVFVASDIFWYWEEGNPAACVSPDVMVVPGVGPRDPRDRRGFFAWDEGGATPAAVFEMVSRSTWREDLDEKYDRYEQLGVKEYFLFDPEGLQLVPPLQGYRLSGKAYRRLRTNELQSELGFGLRAEDSMLRLFDARTGRLIPTRAEAVEVERDRADTAQLRAAAEQQRADAMEVEVERLKALVRKSGGETGGGA
jgi:Uma2 family endonuclease